MTGRPGDHRLSRPDLAAELVQDIINRKVEEREREVQSERIAVERERRRPWLWWTFGLVPILVIVGGWNLIRQAERPRVFTSDELSASVRLRIFLAAKAVQAYRDSTRRLPATLGDVGMDDAGLVYERSSLGYSIADTTGGIPLTYYSGDDLNVFASAYRELALRRRMSP